MNPVYLVALFKALAAAASALVEGYERGYVDAGDDRHVAVEQLLVALRGLAPRESAVLAEFERGRGDMGPEAGYSWLLEMADATALRLKATIGVTRKAS